MSELSDILSGIEGLAPEAISAIENLVKSKETELQTSLEAKYGVKPSVISDVEHVVEDAAPIADKIPGVQELLDRLSSLEAQLAEEKAKAANPEQVIPSGGGDPVPHNLFLDDGTVIKNHDGIATHYTVTVPATATSDATELVRKVVAAYPA